MHPGSNTVLITGGASGIGLGLAERFLRAGSTVVVCGRREEKLREVGLRHPKLRIRVCDLSKESERIALFAWVTRELPRLNMLVNNAGIQLRLSLAEAGKWDEVHEEIAVNLEAPIHLSMLFLPHLVEQVRPTIINVTSGLAFAPIARMPIYCATKAAMHSFTLTLRRQLAGTAIRVVELIPPTVDTDLGGPGLHKFGVSVDEFVDGVMPRLEAGEIEIAYGPSEGLSRASRAELDEAFDRLNAPRE